MADKYDVYQAVCNEAISGRGVSRREQKSAATYYRPDADRDAAGTPNLLADRADQE